MEVADLQMQPNMRIGRIIAVSAAQVVGLLQPRDKNGLLVPSTPIEMGALVKIHTRASTVYGMVSGLRVPLPSVASFDDDLKIVEIELLGEKSNGAVGEAQGFRRGVSTFPALEDPIDLATQQDIAEVYAPPQVATAPVGTIHQDDSVTAYLLVDDLLGKHFSIVGTTGSGKSCAVATILRAVIGRMPNAHVLLIDPHNEYSATFGEQACVLSPSDGLHLPYWLFNFEELAELILGRGHDVEQVKVLADAVLAAKHTHFVKSGLEQHGTVDTPVPYRMSDVIRFLDTAMGALNRGETVAAYNSVKARVMALQTDSRYAFVFGASLSLRDDMSDVLSQLFRIPVAGQPVTILDISGVPSEVLNVVISVICRLTFDFALWSDKPIPITIVCEEAHRYAPRDRQLGFEPAKRALSRIAKEGRKYGVSLCVVSQRPTDLAPGLLSECNTLFALRMSNQEDQEIVRGALPEASHGLMNFLPALRNGEAIAVGEGVSMPMRICFAPLPEENQPRSSTASFARAWSTDIADRTAVAQTIDRWRRGMRDAA
ncbi:MAG TPA: DUF87 domain-containing protein [Stellaceae bacterium]|jgi:hypothetical protein|nr:DUF87 domain-containing protein [Stellaceae bacterium]